MSKEYTTFEMIEKGIKNPVLVFKTTTINGNEVKTKTKHFNDINLNPYVVYWEDEGTPVLLNNVTIDYKWTLENEPVSFMTAVNSGKKIKRKEWSNFYSLTSVGDIFSGLSSEKIKKCINGDWYIED